MRPRATHASSTRAHVVLPHDVCVGFIVLGKRAKQERASNTFARAAIAQLGERQTEDLKVPGSIPGLGIFVLLHATAATSKNNIDWTEVLEQAFRKIQGGENTYTAQAAWSSDMILASGASGLGFNSQSSPLPTT